MDIRLLRTFLTAAESLSFRKAARMLHLSPSTVTVQIKSLQDELGAVLFTRHGRGVRLTRQGEMLSGHVRELLDCEQRIRDALISGGERFETANIRISESLGSYVLPAILPAFRQRFPEARLHLSTHSRDSLERDLRGRIVDAALLLGEPPSAQGLKVEILGREELVVIVPPGSPLAAKASAGAADFAGQILLLTPHVWSARPVIEQEIAASGAPLGGRLECGSVEIVRRLVAAGQGISLAPGAAVAGECARGELRALSWHGPRLQAVVYLAREAARPLPPAAKAFVEAVRAFFATEGK